ncbi:beta strand repeat-containing protein, partial [Rubrivivax sp. A210]|uniref:beta strand repeat-containing protein n=1 Tax=Rubrivivax sp. A210 TaxID=2772301 RepID=UPI00191AF80A
MSTPRRPLLTRRPALRIQALEARLMFDAAAGVDLAHAADAAVALPREATVAPAPLVTEAAPATEARGTEPWLLPQAAQDPATPLANARALAEARLDAFLQQPGAQGQLFALFNGGQAAPTPAWQAAADALAATLRSPAGGLQIEARSATELQGALGAFSASGTNGRPTIYINADYAAQASPAAIEAVLLEEVGHAIDHALNGPADSAGDEGHAFASLLLHGDANLASQLAEADQRMLQLDGRDVAVEVAGPYNVAQISFVPLPEPDVQTALKAVAGATAVSGNIQTVIAISATGNDTIVVYDQWEDGYEADIRNPTNIWSAGNLGGTQIWGDGNAANGVAPGTADDLIRAGQTLLLTNAVNPATPLTVDYDGRDKIGSTQAVAVTRAGWSTTPGTVLAGAVAVVDTGNAGKVYTLPIGQNVDTAATGTNRMFEYTSAHIIATVDGTTVTIDKEGDGTIDATVTLNEGQTTMVNGGLLAGGRISADKGIGVYLIAGDVGAAYENRWFALTADEQWASSYYAPVGTTLAADPATVVLYNPGASAITVYYDTATTTGQSLVVGARSTNYVTMPGSAAHFYTRAADALSAAPKFYAVSTIDSDATSNATHDWSYSLVPETYLTTKFVVGWGPGYDFNQAAGNNGSPVWVTATADTTLYIDSTTVTVKDSKGVTLTGSAFDADTTEYDISALESYRLFDSDKNQSGLTVYTLDGTLITGAWGEDPSIAGAGNPYLDMGTTVLPFPDYVFTKGSSEASTVKFGAGVSDNDSSVELSEQIEYTLTLTNRAVIDLFNINIKDAISPADAATYVAGSTHIKIVRADGTVLSDTTLADDATGTSPFPLARADGGYTLADIDPSTLAVDGLKRGDQVVISYRVQVRSDVNAALANAGFTITNDAQMTGDPAGTGTTITPKTSTADVSISVNGTADGQVFLKDAAFTAATATFQEGATLGVQVDDADANLTAGTDTLTVRVTNSTTGETEDLTLSETSPGVFRATLATSASAGAGNNNGTLLMRTGDSIQVDYTDPVYGAAFDNPTRPGVAGDADNNTATGNANTAHAGIPAPSSTKILYLSDDSAGNLDRMRPADGDGSAATTALIGASSGAVAVTISDSFPTIAYTGGSNWVGNWTEIGDDNNITNGGIRVAATGGDNALYLRGVNGGAVSRGFTALPASSTLTFQIKDGSTTASRNYENTDAVEVFQQLGGNWVSVGSVAGSSIAATYGTQSFTLSAGATGIKFALNINDGSSDRAYIDNIQIVSGYVNVASSSGAVDFPVGNGASAGQTFSFAGSPATADAITVDTLTLSLKKTGSTAATATVSIRSAWDGTALWTGTVSTSQLGTGYQDIALAVTGLTLDKNSSYLIRVDANNSGIVWQGSSTDAFAGGNRLTGSGATAAGDLRFGIAARESQLSSVSFTQGLSMASDFVMPTGGVIKVVSHVSGETNLTGASINATLKVGASTIASSSTPVYSLADHTLTWTFAPLAGARTIAAGQALQLQVTNNAAGQTFRIAYDSANTRSRIELPTTTVINLVDADAVTAGVQEVAFFDKSFANGGTPLAGGFVDAGGVVYVRVKVADPFGDYDVSGVTLAIDGPGALGDLALDLDDAAVIDAGADGRGYKTYEYAWQTVYNVGAYTVGVTAHEGLEIGAQAISDSASAAILVTETDLGTPSNARFLTQLTASGGGDAGALYASGARAYLRITDLDNSGRGSITAAVNGYTVTLTETATDGLFESDLGDAATHAGDLATRNAAAAYFTAMPAARTLVASYQDWNDASDTSTASITVNSPPVAAANPRSIGMDKQATGNAISDDGNGASAGGVDSDVDGQTLTMTAVNGLAGNIGDTITLASGARLLARSDGSYLYDPTSLTVKPTAGTPTVTDSFTYTIADGNGGSSTATVTMTVNYVNPIVIDNQASTDGAVVEFDVSDKFADMNATLSFAASGLPSGLAIDASTGIISGTLLRNASATPSYTVQVTASDVDGVVANVTRSFTWAVSNVAPVAGNDSYTTAEDTLLSANLLSNDNDGAPDSDTLLMSSLNGTAWASLTGGSDAGHLAANGWKQLVLSHGTLYAKQDGSIDYRPLANDTAGDSFGYVISDGNGGTSTATATIAVTAVNDAPTTTAVALAAIAEDSGGRVITQAQLLGNANDIDGDTLVASNLAITVGNGALVNNGNGTWTYTPSANDDASVSFSYTITDNGTTNGGADPKSVSGTATLDITPVNDAPTTSAVTLAAIAEDSGGRLITQAQLLGNAGDIEGDALVASNLAITAGNGALVNNGNGTWTYTPAANDDASVSFSYTITDNGTTNGGADPKSVSGTATLDITPVNDAPTTSAVTLAAIAEDSGGRVITQAQLLGNAVDIEGNGLVASNLAITGGNGSLVDNGNGTWTYTPAANDDASVSFSYTITDNGTTNGGADPKSVSGTATLDITPVNDAPTTSAVTLAAIAED